MSTNIKNNGNLKEIYLAGGCFWGTEKYLSQIKGIVQTDVGYANGNTINPSYEDVCYKNTGHAETVRVVYDSDKIRLEFILNLYFDIVNPISINQQGGDTGSQYRTGIYYVDNDDKDIIITAIKGLQIRYEKPIAIEVLPLENYYIGEEYHQKYLDKNPSGYCHIGKDKFDKVKDARDDKYIYTKKTEEVLRETLTEVQFNVTQNNGTEPPFRNDYYDNFEEGIYVDVTTGEPLFVSSDKFESGCGWPSFSKPIKDELINVLLDTSLGMKRAEVRSTTGDIHLGHVFEDGPKEMGGLRYCINSASLIFIPKDKLKEQGYEQLLPLFSNIEG